MRTRFARRTAAPNSVLTDGETSRSLNWRIERAAERLNIFVAVWTVEGAVYFRLVDSNSLDHP